MEKMVDHVTKWTREEGLSETQARRYIEMESELRSTLRFAVSDIVLTIKVAARGIMLTQLSFGIWDVTEIAPRIKYVLGVLADYVDGVSAVKIRFPFSHSGELYLFVDIHTTFTEEG